MKIPSNISEDQNIRNLKNNDDVTPYVAVLLAKTYEPNGC